VLDLAVNLAATAVGSGVAKIGLWAYRSISRRRGNDDAFPLDVVEILRRRVTELDELTTEASELIGQGTRRLGGVLLLDGARLERYHSLRDRCFEVVRDLDDLVEKHFPAERLSVLGRPVAPSGSRLQQQVRTVELGLKSARTASNSTQSFLQIRGALLAMKDVLNGLAPQ
jgi:hypothetical protein